MIRRYSATDRVQETRTPDTTEYHDIMLESQSSGIIFSAQRPKSKIYQFSVQQSKYQNSETAFLNEIEMDRLFRKWPMGVFFLQMIWIIQMGRPFVGGQCGATFFCCSTTILILVGTRATMYVANLF